MNGNTKNLLKKTKGGSTGCKFAIIIANRAAAGKLSWKEEFECKPISTIIKENLIHSRIKAVLDGEDRHTTELYSLAFPLVTTPEDLAELVAFLASQDPFYLESECYHGPLHDNLEDNYTNPASYTAINLRYKLCNGLEGRPLIMGNFVFFGNTRNHEYTVLTIRPNLKHNKVTTKPNIMGIDQVDVQVSDPQHLKRLKELTHIGVAKKTKGYNRKLFSSKSAVILPQALWHEKAKAFGLSTI